MTYPMSHKNVLEVILKDWQQFCLAEPLISTRSCELNNFRLPFAHSPEGHGNHHHQAVRPLLFLIMLKAF